MTPGDLVGVEFGSVELPEAKAQPSQLELLGVRAPFKPDDDGEMEARLAEHDRALKERHARMTGEGRLSGSAAARKASSHKEYLEQDLNDDSKVLAPPDYKLDDQSIREAGDEFVPGMQVVPDAAPFPAADQVVSLKFAHESCRYTAHVIAQDAATQEAQPESVIPPASPDEDPQLPPSLGAIPDRRRSRSSRRHRGHDHPISGSTSRGNWPRRTWQRLFV
jgi:hypothetical protein